MYYFCTYFDHRYLPRGLSFYHSLRHHCPSFQLWVLCMDRACYDILSQLGLSNIRLIALEDFERGDEELLRAKQNRTLIEYYFTCTPSLPLFILNNCPEVDIITYLDADLFFFADPAPIFDEIAHHSIAIIEHRFSKGFCHLEQAGIYNVGWLSFRRDEHASACLRWWRERCLEWCHDRVENGRYADQKYLDNWPTLFQGVVVLRHKGGNLAPWNLANHTTRRVGNCVWVDEQPLIFFHFHGFQHIKDWLYDPGLVQYKVKPSKIIRQSICMPYIRTLLEVQQQISRLSWEISLHSSIRDQIYVPLPQRIVRSMKRILRICKGIFAREYILTSPFMMIRNYAEHWCNADLSAHRSGRE